MNTDEADKAVNGNKQQVQQSINQVSSKLHVLHSASSMRVRKDKNSFHNASHYTPEPNEAGWGATGGLDARK